MTYKQLVGIDTLAAARKNDPDTSHQAASSVKVRQSHAIVMRAARRAMSVQGGYIRDELRLFMSPGESQNITDSRIRTACKELCDKGFMQVTDEKWHTRTGRLAQVLRLSDKEWAYE